MHKTNTVLVITGALGLGLFVSRSPAAPSLGEKPIRYEYAELRVSRTLVEPPGGARFGGGGPGGALGQFPPGGAAVPAAPAAKVQTTIRWTTGEEELEVKEWEELADKLKAPAPKKVSPPNVHKLRTLNKLSADGWELMDRSLLDATAGASIGRDRVGPGGNVATGALTFRRQVK